VPRKGSRTLLLFSFFRKGCDIQRINDDDDDGVKIHLKILLSVSYQMFKWKLV
jgi:hypothetical protein